MKEQFISEVLQQMLPYLVGQPLRLQALQWRTFDRHRFIFEYKTKDKSIEN